MNKLIFQRVDHDGTSSIGTISLGDISLEIPAIFPTLKTTQNPNDLDYLVNAKNKHDLRFSAKFWTSLVFTYIVQSMAKSGPGLTGHGEIPIRS